MSSKRAAPVIHLRAGEAPAESQTPLEDDASIARIARFVRRLSDAKFFGKLTLSFQNGKITDLRTEQSMKIDDL